MQGKALSTMNEYDEIECIVRWAFKRILENTDYELRMLFYYLYDIRNINNFYHDSFGKSK